MPRLYLSALSRDNSRRTQRVRCQITRPASAHLRRIAILCDQLTRHVIDEHRHAARRLRLNSSAISIIAVMCRRWIDVGLPIIVTDHPVLGVVAVAVPQRIEARIARRRDGRTD